jgi:hypothetical protein
MLFEKKWEMGGWVGWEGGGGIWRWWSQGGDGGGGQGKVAKEQIAKEKREAQGARCQERRNASPPSARAERVPTFSNPWSLLAITSTSGTGPKTLQVAGGSGAGACP